MVNLEIKTPIKFSTVDSIVFQLGVMFPQTKLTDTHLKCVAYYYLYSDALDKLVEAKVFKNSKSGQNYVSDLRKAGLLVGKGKETKVNPKIKLQTNDFKVTLTININEI